MLEELLLEAKVRKAESFLFASIPLPSTFYCIVFSMAQKRGELVRGSETDVSGSAFVCVYVGGGSEE